MSINNLSKKFNTTSEVGFSITPLKMLGGGGLPRLIHIVLGSN